MDPVQILKERCAGREQKAVATELGISPGYLNDVLQRRREPGRKILKALGLRRKITFERVNGRSHK